MKFDITKFPLISDREVELLQEFPDTKFILGIDEVGWGAIAGPLALGGCIMSTKTTQPLFGDSKKLSEKTRKAIIAYGKALPPEEVTNLTYVALAEDFPEGQSLTYVWDMCASLLLDTLLAVFKPDAEYPVFREPVTRAEILVVVDGTRLSTPMATALQQAGMSYVLIPKADLLIRAVSRAAIQAKDMRDFYMTELVKYHPEYEFEKNKGYPTPQHLKLLKEHKACVDHRRNIQVVRDNLPWQEHKSDVSCSHSENTE